MIVLVSHIQLAMFSRCQTVRESRLNEESQRLTLKEEAEEGTPVIDRVSQFQMLSLRQADLGITLTEEKQTLREAKMGGNKVIDVPALAR